MEMMKCYYIGLEHSGASFLDIHFNRLCRFCLKLLQLFKYWLMAPSMVVLNCFAVWHVYTHISIVMFRYTWFTQVKLCFGKHNSSFWVQFISFMLSRSETIVLWNQKLWSSTNSISSPSDWLCSMPINEFYCSTKCLMFIEKHMTIVSNDRWISRFTRRWNIFYRYI